jgi:hypothetical protein
MKNVSKIATEIWKTSASGQFFYQIKELAQQVPGKADAFLKFYYDMVANHDWGYDINLAKEWIKKVKEGIADRGTDIKTLQTLKKYKLASGVHKEADSVSDISRILKTKFDEKTATEAMKLINLLDRIDYRSKDVTVKLDLETVKNKLRNATSQVQEAWEELFSMQQRLIAELESEKDSK